MLVKLDSVAVPWDTTSGATKLASVNASAWRFTNHGLAPYEFAYGAMQVPLHYYPIQSFLLELGAILEKRNLDNILGICLLSEKSAGIPPAIEFTSGRANITLPFDITPNDGNVIDAMWQLSSKPLSSSTYTDSVSQG